jgi:hypothetical protein
VESVDREIQSGHVVVATGDARALAEGIKAQIARKKGAEFSGVRGANLDAERTWYNLIAAIEKL